MPGVISHYKLDTWWNTEFTEEERNTIENVFVTTSTVINGLTGEISTCQKKIMTSGNYSFGDSKFQFLSILLDFFKKPEYFQIAQKIIKLADTFAKNEKDVIELHYYFLHKIRVYYRNRDTSPDALDLAIQACLDQIKISAQTALYLITDSKKIEHTGFQQLCIIYDKQAKYKDVIQLSELAKKQGWAGTWDNRIAKAKNKLGKSGITNDCLDSTEHNAVIIDPISAKTSAKHTPPRLKTDEEIWQEYEKELARLERETGDEVASEDWLQKQLDEIDEESVKNSAATTIPEPKAEGRFLWRLLEKIFS